MLELEDGVLCARLFESQHLFKTVIHAQTVFNLLNRLDELLERMVPLQAHQNVICVLITLQNVVNNKANRGYFRSLDRLLEILRLTSDLTTIQYVLNIVILFFKSRDNIQKKEYEYFEPSFKQLFYFTKNFMDHQNTNNKQEVNLCDYFKDDEGYARFLATSKEKPKPFSY